MERKKQVVDELHKQARRNYQRRKFDIREIDETWQADLVEMQPFASENRNHKYLLTVIDIFSKYAWAVPVKQKTGVEVTKAMKSILRQGRIPKKLHTDEGKEFYNSNFKSLMKEYNIHLYSTHSNLKASICERFNRTLKTRMWKQFSLQGTYRWLGILDDLVDDYNNRVHRTIGMKPADVTRENEAQVKKKYAIQVVERKRAKFRVGDKVRVSRSKLVFEKGYTPNWSTEIFTVRRIVRTNPLTYQLNDYQDQPIEGGFYEEELSKVRYPDIYLVEKVLRRRGDQIYVKWLGFDSSHNSWINKSDI